MIGAFWNNILTAKTAIIISSGDVLQNLTIVDLQKVMNRGELAGIVLDALTKAANPGSGKTFTVYYAFSMRGDRTAVQLQYAAGSQSCTIENAGAGTSRGYSLPISYQGGRYLYIWFSADAFTDSSAKLELDLTVLAKTMN